MSAWVSSSFDIIDLSPPSSPPAAPRGILRTENGQPPTSPQAVKRRRTEAPAKAAANASSNRQVESGTGDLLVERSRPTLRSDLCVHVKKVAEVAQWLRMALSPEIQLCRRRRRPDELLLLLTGPPGAGKTATVRCLAAELGARLCEWSAPLGGGELAKLEEFLFRSDRYDVASAEDGGGERLLLLEDLPPAMIDDPGLLRQLLERHAAVGRSPLVVVVSDSQHKALAAARLLPRAVQEALGLAVIRFNPVAPTQLTKALQRVTRGEARKSRGSRAAAASPEIAQIVAECGGDIRCALNQLHFLLAKAAKRKNEGEESGRDNNLTIFRALGKVLHCKRLPVKAPHSSPCGRPPLAFEPETVVEASRLPGPLFAAFLHENSPDFFASIEEFAEAAESFALADLLSACWQEGRPPGQQIADLYAGPLAARGVAFAKREPKSVGFRPLRRPALLSLAWSGAGTEPRRELLDLRPFRRAIANGGRPCRMAVSKPRNRFTRALTEHDCAFEETSTSRHPTVPPREFRNRAAEEEEALWTIAEENEDAVLIEDSD